VALDGGQIRGLRWIPSGVAFRAEAEFGEGLGGDFAFNRYLGDIRAYLRPGRDTGLSLRLRGGTTTGEAPIQKSFTLGGAGSLRAYPQNIFRGTSMLLANAEVTLYDVSIFDDLLSDLAVFGIADAGWVDGPSKAAFDTGDLITSAGFGVGLSDRQVRLELAWPLRNLGTGMEPTLWLRLNPTF
jgi:hemolysin activation/secretion protein